MSYYVVSLWIETGKVKVFSSSFFTAMKVFQITGRIITVNLIQNLYIAEIRKEKSKISIKIGSFAFDNLF